MKQLEKNIFSPNILLFIGGIVSTIFFSVLLTYIIIDKAQNDKPLELFFLLVIDVFFIWLFFNYIDAWTIKIDKGKIHIKRLWSRHWQTINIDTFDKIKFSAKLDDYIIEYKKLTLYTTQNKKYNFYSYTDNLGDNFYLALLNQTPKLLDDYKKRKREIQNKITARQQNYKLITMILLFILVLLTLWMIK